MPFGSRHCPGRLVSALVAAAGVSACGGGGGGGGPQGNVGVEVEKPGGGFFFVDAAQGGRATRLHLVEMSWARLVDVHDVDEDGRPSVQPVFRDFAVNESILSDGANYTLSTNPITQETRLIIHRPHHGEDDGSGTFLSLLRDASQALAPVIPKHDDGSASEPFSFVARNSVLVLRFDDVLSDGHQQLVELSESVDLLTGYPPTVPFASRILFDPNHGALVSNAFHSTRLLIDLTVSEAEAVAAPVPLELNSLGLPPSLTTTAQPNISLRLPTRTDPASGQFTILHGLSGVPLSTQGNGPVDLLSPTLDVVRAFRAGNRTDANNGFQVDLNEPSIAGAWPATIELPRADAAGIEGFDFIVDLRFTTPCRSAPEVGDISSVGALFLEVSAPGSFPNSSGVVNGLRVRSLRDAPIADPQQLLGSGLYLSTYDAAKPVATGCWVSFAPQPEIRPQTHVAPDGEASIRFTEPMDPASISPFESLVLVRGGPETAPAADSVVVARIRASDDLKEFTFSPLLPLAHEGQEELYHFEFGAITDLAGNPLPDTPTDITFSIDPGAEQHINGSVVLRFGSDDEVEPLGVRDLRGQFFYDLDLGKIRPRPPNFQGVAADRGNPVPSIMIPFPSGVQTPLAPLGSKLQTVWRYADLGWAVRDETKYNLDVVGLSWAPIGDQVINDFYENFEIRLSHSRFLPDECIDRNSLLPRNGQSGLRGSPSFYTENILFDPLATPRVVHPRSLGYVINPSDLYRGVSGNVYLPYPLNRGPGPILSYTWRDTAVLAKGGPNGDGIPMCIEVGTPLFLEPIRGAVAPSGQVPSFGLPLLMEYRCYPSDSGVGLNSLDVSLAVNSSAQPNFRAYSTGGINRLGNPVRKDPDLELVPSGGFNPNSNPPGRRTQFDADNTFYIGQLDYVPRVSRVHTMWFDSLDPSPDYSDPLSEPSTDNQPLGTQVLLDFRGAASFSLDAMPFDASLLNPYGDLTAGTVTFHNNVKTWTSDIDVIDGARYVQLRISFLSNIDTGLSPELSAVGIAYSFE